MQALAIYLLDDNFLSSGNFVRINVFKHDIIIVGGGLAQGGINAALGSNDKWEDHAFDTVKGSDYPADQDAVEVLCKEAPDRVLEIRFLRHWYLGKLLERMQKNIHVVLNLEILKS